MRHPVIALRIGWTGHLKDNLWSYIIPIRCKHADQPIGAACNFLWTLCLAAARSAQIQYKKHKNIKDKENNIRLQTNIGSVSEMGGNMKQSYPKSEKYP